MKKFIIAIILLSFPFICFSSPSNSISIPNSFTPNTTISSSSMNSNFNEIQTKFNTHTHTDITALGAITTGSWLANIIAKDYGGTGNAYGLGLPSGAVFFMISGSCPSGTTDVSATYSNKFVKINATQGTSSGTVLTGATDSHTLDTTEIPSHTHSYNNSNAPANVADGGSSRNVGDSSGTTGSTGGGGGHTHTLSSATTLEPSSITCKMCQVN